MTPRIGSLFSGYGGLDMAVQAVYGGEVAWYSEIDKHACTVLEAHHPGVPNLGDITAVDWADVPPIDILTGGYPCQPFSHAGQRKGTKDERHLWPYVRDAIVALRPVVTVLENVDGHRSLGLDAVLGDLADLGLSARWGVVRAADAGAPHGRKRVFITVADAARWAGREGQGRGLPQSEGAAGLAAHAGVLASDSFGQGSQGCSVPTAAVHGAGSRRVGAVDSAQPAADATSGGGGSLRAGRSSKAGAATRLGRNGELPAADTQGGRRREGQGSPASQAGRGQQGAGDDGGALAADADGTGGEARGITGPDSQRLRSQPVGLAALAPDASGQRHGRGQDVGVVGRMGSASEVLGWPASTSWQEPEHRGSSGVDWGKYAPAIRRWESLTRPAPDPTIPGTNGRPRLSPAFVEWMMGLPAGHVTGHGLKPAACLKMLGNGVVPQQAELALRMLAVTDA